MKILNPRNLPESLVLAATGEVRTPNPMRFGVNELIGPPMIRKLSHEHYGEFVEVVESRFWLMLGLAWHNYMEKFAPANSVAEEKIEITWDDEDGPFTISGIPDLYYGDTLIDYKLTSVWSYIYGGKTEWEAQLNIYAWMIHKKHGIKINNLSIIAGFRDWSERGAENSSDYPPAQIMEIAVPIWELGAVEDYIWHRMNAHKNGLPCTPEERYHKADTWAVMAKGRKSAHRVLDSEAEANQWIEAKRLPGLYVEKRVGEDKRCKSYCPVRNFCPNNTMKGESDVTDS